MSFLGIGKKEENPVDLVTKDRSQGLSDSQIIQNMQNSGYTPQEIHDALSQADLAAADQGLPSLDSQELSAQPPQLPPTQLQNPTSTNQNMQSQFQPPAQAQTMQISPLQEDPKVQGYQKEQVQDMVEEIAEAIIEEKWDDLLKDIGKIVDWKNKTETRLTSLEQKFSDLKDNFDELHKAIISKIGDYDQNILNVGAEIKAMEKVFQDVLPMFTDNVNELSRIVDKVKKKKR